MASIRKIAVGKKNWLFAGSERAGSGLRPSRVGTAKLNGLDPQAEGDAGETADLAEQPS